MDKLNQVTKQYWVKVSGINFGIEVEGTQVVEAPPFGKWMVGKSFVYVCEWIAKKHGTIEQVGEES